MKVKSREKPLFIQGAICVGDMDSALGQENSHNLNLYEKQRKLTRELNTRPETASWFHDQEKNNSLVPVNKCDLYELIPCLQ